MDNEDEVRKWWAYRHIYGGIKVKLFTGQDAIEDAYDSNFVDEVLDPYPAKDRNEAESIALARLSKKVVNHGVNTPASSG